LRGHCAANCHIAVGVTRLRNFIVPLKMHVGNFSAPGTKHDAGHAVDSGISVHRSARHPATSQGTLAPGGTWSHLLHAHELQQLVRVRTPQHRSTHICARGTQYERQRRRRLLVSRCGTQSPWRCRAPIPQPALPRKTAVASADSVSATNSHRP
jgi:hypothetical protein